VPLWNPDSRPIQPGPGKNDCSRYHDSIDANRLGRGDPRQRTEENVFLFLINVLAAPAGRGGSADLTVTRFYVRERILTTGNPLIYLDLRTGRITKDMGAGNGRFPGPSPMRFQCAA